MVNQLFSELTIADNNGNNGTDEEQPSADIPTDPRDAIIQKPPNDDTSYRVLTLKNGLRCLLVSDAEITKSENAAVRSHKDIESTDKAAACLTVRVGHAQNPREIPGYCLSPISACIASVLHTIHRVHD